MRGKYAIVRARRDVACTERSYHLIRKGDRHLYAACPPEHECNRGRKWRVVRACLRRAGRRGLHTAEARRAAEGVG